MPGQNAFVEKAFNEAAENMVRYFRGLEADIPNPGEKGGIRERRVTSLLAKYLPKKYGFGSGHIIDSEGNISEQVDIVIYDALNGVIIPQDENYAIFPSESVYATIEVKSTLDNEKIIDCARNATSINSLKRKYDLPPINSFVFAYSTVWKNDQWAHVADKFYQNGRDYKYKIPEMVFVLEPPSFALCSYKLDGERDKDRYSHRYEKNPLLLFVTELTTRLSNQQVTTPRLWDDYVKWLPMEAIAKIIPAVAYPLFQFRVQ